MDRLKWARTSASTLAHGVVLVGIGAALGWPSAASITLALWVYGHRESPRLAGAFRRRQIPLWLPMIATAVLAVVVTTVSVTINGLSAWNRNIRPIYTIALPVVQGSPRLRFPEPLRIPQPADEEIAAIERAARSSLARNLITLFERDPESWPPRIATNSPFRLDEDIDPPMVMKVGQRQRFNPQLNAPLSADNLRDAVVFIYFPRKPFGDDGTIEAPPQWQVTEDRTGQSVIYLLRFGDVVKTYSGAPIDEAMYLTTKTAGVFPIKYVIGGQGEATDALPLTRSFSITVRP